MNTRLTARRVKDILDAGHSVAALENGIKFRYFTPGDEGRLNKTSIYEEVTIDPIKNICMQHEYYCVYGD